MDVLGMLDAAEVSCPPMWRGKFLQYRMLQQLVLKRSATAQPGVMDCGFFKQLEEDIVRVNRVFESSATSILARARRPAAVQRLLGDQGNVMQQAIWCRCYAEVNAVALREVLHFYDKTLSSDEGRAYLQGCWAGNDLSRGGVLHSPMLTELKAIELLHKAKLQSQQREELRRSEQLRAGVAQRLEAGGSPTGVSMPDISRSNPQEPGSTEVLNKEEAPVVPGEDATVPAGSGVSDDHKCSICLDVLYQPVGLKCGHMFCKRCLHDAVAVPCTIDSSVYERDRIAPSAKCPDCRQQEVCIDALELKLLGRLLKMWFPEVWAERRSLERARRREINTTLRKEQKKAVQRRMAGSLILGRYGWYF